MTKDKKLVIFGDRLFAEVAWEYFSTYTSYEVIAFTVTGQFKTRPELFGLPVVAFEEIQEAFPPCDHEMFIALTYRKLNRVREQFFHEAKEKGYRLASFVSPQAFIAPSARLGENCFVFENNVVQSFVSIGDNVILWSGNHIGHHSSISEHCFIASHAVICGSVKIGARCFIGVNSTIVNDIEVGAESLVGAGALVKRSLPEKSFVKGIASGADSRSTDEIDF